MSKEDGYVYKMDLPNLFRLHSNILKAVYPEMPEGERVKTVFGIASYYNPESCAQRKKEYQDHVLSNMLITSLGADFAHLMIQSSLGLTQLQINTMTRKFLEDSIDKYNEADWRT